jgi:hypothetical protein
MYNFSQSQIEGLGRYLLSGNEPLKKNGKLLNTANVRNGMKDSNRLITSVVTNNHNVTPFVQLSDAAIGSLPNTKNNEKILHEQLDFEITSENVTDLGDSADETQSNESAELNDLTAFPHVTKPHGAKL